MITTKIILYKYICLHNTYEREKYIQNVVIDLELKISLFRAYSILNIIICSSNSDNSLL